MTAFPVISARHKFHPKTACGKLKAEITPTSPNGFHVSIIKCSLRSEGISYPLKVLDNPQAKSHMSIDS